MDPVVKNAFLIIFFTGMSLIVLSRVLIFAEQQYAQRYYKPLFYYPVLIRQDLNIKLQNYLHTEFEFYRNLNAKNKRKFRHRLVRFMNSKEFIGKEHVVVTDEMKVLISATATMLTFGFRNYLMPIVAAIFVFPDKFNSLESGAEHIGEFSPRHKSVAFSW